MEENVIEELRKHLEEIRERDWNWLLMNEMDKLERSMNNDNI